MVKQIGMLLSAKNGLILVIFLMPFVNVSCTNMVNIPLSGMDLATGKTIEIKEPFGDKVTRERIDPEPYATIALGIAVIGLLVGFAGTRFGRLINAVAGAAGATLLLLLKGKIDDAVMREGGGLISVNYEAGYWIALVLFLLASIVSVLGLLDSSRE